MREGPQTQSGSRDEQGAAASPHSTINTVCNCRIENTGPGCISHEHDEGVGAPFNTGC